MIRARTLRSSASLLGPIRPSSHLSIPPIVSKAACRPVTNLRGDDELRPSVARIRHPTDITKALQVIDKLPSLKQNFRGAARAEAEESEREAAQLAMRDRSLSDVAFEAMASGGLIAVTAGLWTFTGLVVYAAGDL